MRLHCIHTIVHTLSGVSGTEQFARHRTYVFVFCTVNMGHESVGISHKCGITEGSVTHGTHPEMTQKSAELSIIF